MKPSERRALRELEAQKKNSVEVEIEEGTTVFEDNPSTAEPKKRNKKEKSILDDDVISMRREGFIQSNVKLITFIICMVVFLGAATIIPLVHWLDHRTEVKGETPMKLEDVISISSKKKFISWDDFEGYVYTDQSSGKVREHMYLISGTDYVLMVSGPKSDKKYPDSIVLCDLNNTSYTMDLTSGNIQAFLSGASKTPTKYIKLSDVEELASIAVYLRWADFADYKYYEKTEAAPDKQSMTIIRMYPVEDADLLVYVYGKRVYGEPDKVMLVDGLNSKNTVDVTNIKDTKAFIEKYKSDNTEK